VRESPASGDRLVALLRGINVGRAKRIAMADLRRLFEELGYRHVRTILNSGNVVFSAPKSARAEPRTRIEKALAKSIGVPARVTILTADEVTAIVRGNPLLDVATNPSRLLVAVLAEPADRPKLEELGRRDWAPEAMSVGARAGYFWMPGGVIGSRLARELDRALGDAVTSRNWSTVLKLEALASQPSS
jgi:uncharacterized protein (DUF1697 family)